jgi:hypothetical protein
MGSKPSRLPGGIEHALDSVLDKALAVQRPVVLTYVAKMRERNPAATPEQLIGKLERHYRSAVVGLGGASGAAAAVPGVGTGAVLASGAAEIAAFVSTTAMFVLAVAEVHGLPVSDPEVRRALVLAALLGDTAEAALVYGEFQAPHWAQVLGRSASRDRITGLNARLARLVLGRFGRRQGALALGRALPLGVGAGIGAIGNAALARTAIASTRKAFGPPPRTYPPRVIDASNPDGSHVDGRPG